jgi:BirA family biotin operon repressor/biotin-[acetyl-CoA-carboxylase] ligase
LATHYDIVSVDSVPSTQDEASKLRELTNTTTLVVADRQTLGRGRHGRTWEEPSRGLYSSLAFETKWPPEDRATITLCAAVALASSIEDAAGASCDVKWPNDLLIGGAKVAGILVEATADVVVVGCGVNLWWPDAPAFAAGIFDDDPGEEVALGAARGWVERLLEMLDDGPGAWPRAEYLRRSWTVGRTVSWDNGMGLAVGIAPGGGLVVETEDGDSIITAGEVHTRQER